AVQQVARKRNVVPDVDVIEEMRMDRNDARRIDEDVLAGEARLQHPVERQQHAEAHRQHCEMKARMRPGPPRALLDHAPLSTAPASPPESRLPAHVSVTSSANCTIVSAAA